MAVDTPPVHAHAAATDTGVHEQMRARYPDAEGLVERDGVRVAYEVYGEGGPTILFVPTWHIVHSRLWKAQIPYFARHCRVVTFDPRGNGKSDRPAEPEAYDEREMAADIVAVMDATGTARATLVIVVARRPTRSAGRRRAPGSGGWLRLRSARPADRLGASRDGAGSRSTTRWAPTRAGRSTTRTTGGATRRTSSSSSSRDASTSRTRPSRSRTASAGATRSDAPTLVGPPRRAA